MRVCSNCGNPLKDGQEFCGKCGAKALVDEMPVGGETSEIVEDEFASDDFEQKIIDNSGYGDSASNQYDTGNINNTRNQYDTGYVYNDGAPYGGGNQPYNVNKKKSKKPIIITCTIIGVLIIALVTYLCIAFMQKSNLSDKCDELKSYIEKGVVLNENNGAIYDEAKDSEDSLNVSKLLDEQDKVDDLLDMSREYMNSSDVLNSYKANGDTLIGQIEDNNIDVETLSNYTPFNESLDNLEQAIENNNVGEMVKEKNAVKKDYDRYKDEVDKTLSKNKKTLEEAQTALDGWKDDFRNYEDDASENHVSSDIDVETEHDSAKDLLEQYEGYLDEKDLSGANGMAEDVIKQLDEYKKAIELAIKDKEGGDGNSGDGGTSTGTDDYYALPDIDTVPISGNPFSGYGLTKKQEFCLLCIAKNEVFAKRGYIFGSTLARYFEDKSWYTPDSTVDDDDIMRDLKEENGIEYKNLKKIQKLIDKYAKEYSWAGKTVKKSDVTTADFDDAIEAWYEV